jgi:hypothetical protein
MEQQWVLSLFAANKPGTLRIIIGNATVRIGFLRPSGNSSNYDRQFWYRQIQAHCYKQKYTGGSNA